ncbi:MAG: prolipoprotein diacylglyceryl transferase, partial [bacterium]|nr:prolipoprotein diacylglyceryl transferase [bacterium]
MLPYLVKIGTVLVPTHAVTMSLAYVVSIIGFLYWARKMGIDMRLILNGALIGIPATIIGARLSAVLMLSSDERLSWFLDDPVRILRFWRGGMSYYGVMSTAMVVGTWYFLRSGLPARKTTDLMIPWHALAYFIQCFGCLAAGCHYGFFTDLPWGIYYLQPGFAGPRGFALHPFPLYVAVMTILGWFLAYCWVQIKYFQNRLWTSFHRVISSHFLRVRFVEGELLPLAGIYYSAGRFLTEFTRSPSLQIWYPNWPLPQSQMACIFVFCFSL